MRYDEIHGDSTYHHMSSDAITSRISSLIRAAGRPLSLLDACCGTGLVIEQLDCLENLFIDCVDANINNIDYARRKYKSRRNVNWICENILDFQSARKYDCVLARWAYHHFEDDQKLPFLRALKSLLEGGTLILVDWFLLPYNSEDERRRNNLRRLKYHKAYHKQMGHRKLYEVELQNIQKAVSGTGRSKFVSCAVIEKQLLDAQFTDIEVEVLRHETIDDPELFGQYMITAKAQDCDENLR